MAIKLGKNGAPFPPVAFVTVALFDSGSQTCPKLPTRIDAEPNRLRFGIAERNRRIQAAD